MSPPAASQEQLPGYDKRWWTLAVLCLSLLVISIDNTILNVAIPSLIKGVKASESDLQWIIDAYTIVFASLLLTAGSLSDRFSRKRALSLGLVVFGVGSAVSATAGTPGHLVATRAVMGLGGAFIMPSTLSILTNVFPARERGRAIGIWAGVSGVGVAVGPVTGGLLLRHFWWGSVFLVNVPVVVLALVAGRFLVPDSRDPAARRLDPLGALLSVLGLTGLLYAIIEVPQKGWADGTIVASFLVGLSLLVAFALWELHSSHPMLEVGFFKDPRFSAASGTITLAMFALYGSTFLLTQYLQLVIGFTPLQAGLLATPVAVALMVVAPNSPRLVARFGPKRVVASGMAIVTVGLLLYAVDGVLSSVLWGSLTRALFGIGIGMTIAPCTESIMSTLPLGKAGVGSAVNDTTRQVGGALGVACVGSVFSAVYSRSMAHRVARLPLDPAQGAAARNSIGRALGVAGTLGASPVAARLADEAKAAFTHAMGFAFSTGAAVALLSSLVALVFLPAQRQAARAPAEATEGASLDTPAVAPTS